MSFSIVTDTSANLPLEIVMKYDITVIPLSCCIDGKEELLPNINNFDEKQFYNNIRDGIRVTTSQVPPQRYIDYLSKIIAKGNDVLFIGMSSGISGSFSAAKIAADQLKAVYFDRKICLIDSLGASFGEGLLVKKAVECREKNMNIEETAVLLDDFKYCIYQVFIVDDLRYLHKTGRISNMTTLIGTMLDIKPLLKGNEEGKIVSFGKIRGRKKAIETLAEKYNILATNYKSQIVFISHTDCLEDAKHLKVLICQKHKPREVLIVCHEPVTGSHLGPGALALYFVGNKDVRYK